jgi:hypothetical protein
VALLAKLANGRQDGIGQTAVQINNRAGFDLEGIMAKRAVNHEAAA